MKYVIKNFLAKHGVRINLEKNLWYLDSYTILKRQCSMQEPIIFDVGACDGSSVITFKELYPQATIYSFEPLPESFKQLERVAGNFINVISIQKALSDKAEMANFYVNRAKETSSLFPANTTNSFIDDHAVPEDVIKVQCTTVDQFNSDGNINRIDILKLDVQGGELKVLEGARTALSNKTIKLIYTEIWFIEGYSDQPLYHQIAQYLSRFGYLPFGIYNMHYRKDGHFLWGDAIFYST